MSRQPIPITVAPGPANRPQLTQAEQIALVLERARAKGEPIRIRLPFSLYDYDPVSRGYVFLKDATWNLQLPSAHEGTEEALLGLIQTLGACVMAIATHGHARVDAVLREMEERG